MVKTNFGIGRVLASGYTMVELLVVLGVMGFVAAITLFGIRAQSNDQLVSNAQREIVVNLTSAQTRVVNGQLISPVTATFNHASSTYVVAGTTFKLPGGVKISIPLINPVVVYFSHPEDTNNISGCGSAAQIYACTSGSIQWSTTASPCALYIGFAGSTRKVCIEGSGKVISRIYAP